MLKVARALVQFDLRQIRCVNVLISQGSLALQNVLFEQPTHRRPLGQPQRKTSANRVAHGEQLKLSADTTVVAALGLLEAMQILVELFLRGKGGAVDALQHRVVLVAPPVGAGDREQLHRTHLRA